MTDVKDDGQKTQKTMSFKEHILAELEKANQIRKEKEEELLKQGLEEEELRIKEKEAQEAAKRTLELYREYQEEDLKSRQAQVYDDNQEKLVNETRSEEVDKDKQPESDIPTSDTSDASNAKDKTISDTYSNPIDKNRRGDSLEEKDFSETIPFTPITILDQSQLGNLEEVQHGEEMEQNDSNQSEGDVDHDRVTNKENQGSVNPLLRAQSSKRHRADRVAKKISMMLISSILILIILGGLLATLFVYNAVNPVDKKDDKYVQVEVPMGSGNKLIGQLLEEKGLIKSGTVFNFFTKFKNYGNFQSGYYNFQKSMSLEDIAKTLQKGGTDKPTKPALGKILITEGSTIKQMSVAISNNVNTKTTKDKTPFSAKEFLDTVQDEAFIKEMVKKYPRLLSSIPSKSEAIYQLEGYLFPATYNYHKETRMKDLIDEMLATTDATLSPYYESIATSGKTVNDVLTLASLVEKEGSTDGDRRDIASVFYNRLNNGMALQSNIAILYAMNKLGEKTTLAEDASIDTTIKSPYNIYTNTGLMPGPVASPGLSAIDATIKPANTDYLYFVANVKTGEVFYAKTYEEHSKNVEKYVNSQIQ